MAEGDADFQKLLGYFKERNYPAVKKLAKDLIEDKKYFYPVSIILSEVYFQENDFATAEDILKELIFKFPERENDIKKRLEKIEREKKFFDKVVRDRSRRFEVFFSEESKEKDEKILNEVIDILDDAVYYGGKFFGWYPDYIIKVIIYYSEEYKNYTVLPLWSSGGFDGKIRLKISKNISKEHLKEIIYHEYAHLAIDGLTKSNCPLWLNEGIAQYFAKKQMGKLIDLKKQIISPDEFPKNLSSKNEEEIQFFYDGALNTVNYLVKSSGEYIIGDLLNQLGNEKEFKNALNNSVSYLGLSYEILFNQ